MDMETEALAKTQAAIFSVFANPKRVQIFWALRDQEKTVSEITAVVGASLQNTSQHLRLMKESGILDSRREAQKIYYHIAENDLAIMCYRFLQAHRMKCEEDPDFLDF